VPDDDGTAVSLAEGGGGDPASTATHAGADSPLSGDKATGAYSNQGGNQWLQMRPGSDFDVLYTCTAKDIFSNNICSFKVFNECVNATCSCVHMIAGARAQLLPCRVFAECFVRGDTDPDWEYIMRGVIFGFKVINEKCDARYFVDNYKSVLEPVNSKIITSLTGASDAL